MNKEHYLAQRKALLDEAETLVLEGKVDEANEKMEDVRKLDAKWEDIAKAQANLSALNGSTPNVNQSNIAGLQVEGQTAGSASMGGNSIDSPMDDFKSDMYKTAWAKYMMNKPLSVDEQKSFEMVNTSLTTENSSVVIPEGVAKGIWQEAAELYPYWNDVSKTYVKGNLTVIKGDTSSNAAWYDESTSTAEGSEAFGSLNLTGCELSRAINVSWRLKEMAIEDFIPYIQRHLAEKMGAGLGYGSTHGKGKPGENDTFKPEPLGIVTALNKESGTPQVKTYTAGNLSYKDITSTRALIKSGYASGLKVYANSTTIWTELANVVDDNGRPVFVADAINGGVYKVLGAIVEEDGSMLDGEILFSNAGAGYTANVNKQLSVSIEDHVKARNTDYCGYAIVDGGALTTKAHALLKKA